MRYRVTASGSDNHPPIDGQEFKSDPMPMLKKRGYRFIHCALLTVISREALKDALFNQREESP